MSSPVDEAASLVEVTVTIPTLGRNRVVLTHVRGDAAVSMTVGKSAVVVRLDDLYNAFTTITGAFVEVPRAGRSIRPVRTGPSKNADGKNRLARRSIDEIETDLSRIVEVLITSALPPGEKGGMRSEVIRRSLGCDIRELPRVLKHGVASGVLCSVDEKRSTRYFLWTAR